MDECKDDNQAGSGCPRPGPSWACSFSGALGQAAFRKSAARPEPVYNSGCPQASILTGFRACGGLPVVASGLPAGIGRNSDLTERGRHQGSPLHRPDGQPD
ncbi:hypothetical protein PGT21_025917 [Puccinia graminis f. sp. tritici]|uniref:Uncharacterized protein n=1 Tax=Puccinia graminis f. sp. tritici TaxID=56615 RepID=A0A5B0S2V8_PUCGR|nr:hypothetical protein PGT21_025917 [Puccinia graminis f. sp. tritici]KAA1131705.1 hypothetical protein PGTUg99_013600 [Puccinia graminis f. sp. tritici]